MRSDLKDQGPERKLMEKFIDYLRSRDTSYVVGQVMGNNHGMLRLARTLGFKLHRLPADEVVEVRLELQGRGYFEVAT